MSLIQNLRSKVRNIRTLPVGKALSISVFNQFVSSGTNFALGLYLVRSLSPTEFGLYSLGFAISLVYAGIGNALFLTQMVVHTPEKTVADRLPYAARIFIAVSGFSMATIFIVSAVFIFMGMASQVVAKFTGFGIAVTIASSAYLIKEFFIRHAYNERQESRALMIHIVLAVSILALLISAHVIDRMSTGVMALCVYALALSCASLYGHLKTGLPLRSINKVALISDLKEAWGGGVYSVLAHIIISLKTQAHTIVIAASIGPIGIAKLNASRIFVAPAVTLMPALTQLFLPRMTDARWRDNHKGAKVGNMFSVVMLGVAAAYSIFILLTFNYLSPMITGDRYESLFWLVAAWCLYTCLTALRSGQELMLVAFKFFKRQALVNAYGAAMALSMVYILARTLNEVGAVIGLALAEILVIVLLWYTGRIVTPSGYRLRSDHIADKGLNDL